MEKGKPILRKKFVDDLCSDQIEFILAYNKEFLEKLQPRVKNWTPTQKIGDLFLELVGILRVLRSKSYSLHRCSRSTLSIYATISPKLKRLTTRRKTKRDSQSSYGYNPFGFY